MVEGLPEGMVKSELLKALERVEKKIARELDASQSAWEREPTLKRIETSGVTVQNSNDLLVLLAHCLLEEAGLVCSGSLRGGDEAKNARTSDAESSSNASTPRTSVSDTNTTAARGPREDPIVPDGWNGGDGSAYGLRYVIPTSTSPSAKPGESLTLKALPIGERVSLHLVQDRTGKSQAVELTVTDFVANRGRIIRADSIANLRTKLRSQLIDRLFPPPSASSSSSSSSSRRPRANDPLRIGSAGGGRRGNPQLRRPPYTPFAPGGLGRGGGNLGDFDRDLRPHFGGGMMGGGPSFGIGGGGGGGSLMGPDHPMFRGGDGRPGYPSSLPTGVPPGARFDPYGPGVGVPPRRGGGRGGTRPTPGPTPDHLPPPRFDGGGDDDDPPSTMFF